MGISGQELVLLGWDNAVQVTIAAESFIPIGTTHDNLLIRILPPVTEKTRSSIAAPTAERSQPVNSIGQRNAIEDLTKLAAVGVTIQSYKIDVLAMRIHCPLHKWHEILEELCLIDNDDIVGCNVDIVQILRMNARSAPAVMRSDNTLAIPIVRNVSNH